MCPATRRHGSPICRVLILGFLIIWLPSTDKVSGADTPVSSPQSKADNSSSLHHPPKSRSATLFWCLPLFAPRSPLQLPPRIRPLTTPMNIRENMRLVGPTPIHPHTFNDLVTPFNRRGAGCAGEITVILDLERVCLPDPLAFTFR